MFLRSRIEENRTMINTDHIRIVEKVTSEEQAKHYIYMLIHGSADPIRWRHDTEEGVTQEFEWIMSKLDCVQNVPESEATVIDEVDLRVSKKITWCNEGVMLLVNVLEAIRTLTSESECERIKIIVSYREFGHILATRMDNGSPRTIGEIAIDECKEKLNKTLSFEVKSHEEGEKTILSCRKCGKRPSIILGTATTDARITCCMVSLPTRELWNGRQSNSPKMTTSS